MRLDKLVAIEPGQATARQSRDLLVELAAETNMGKLLERILEESRRLSRADGGTIYLMNHPPSGPELVFSLMTNHSLGIHQGGFSGQHINLPPVRLYTEKGEKNHNNVVSYAALKKKVVKIDDAYNTTDFDFSGTRSFDRRFSYESRSFLTVPLLNHDHDVIGVLQLLNATDDQARVVAFSDAVIAQVTGLAGYAAIALNNHLLVKDLKDLLDAFIKCIAQAIDAKSAHTSSHCQRIPLLMEIFAKAACDDQSTFRDFSLNDDEWYELKVASWLHDCGKLSTPDTVLDKSTKLHLMQDGVETIKMRFSAAKLAAEKAAWQQIADDPERRKEILQNCAYYLADLDEDMTFIAHINQGGEFMAASDKHRLHLIAEKKYLASDGAEYRLVTDEEVEYLCIERGTLSKQERHVINNHMSVTIDMLESLPFPRKLKRVPEYAGGHHEKMDGSGFPRGLTREQMSIPARMMAIADIFEALTSRDRPYKQPMKISQALAILERMKNEQHIDPDLFDLFVNARVWEEYAKRELLPEQLDI